MSGGIFLFLLGSLLVVVGSIGILSIREAIIQWAAGHRDFPSGMGCLTTEGHAYSYEEQVMQKWWTGPFLAIGSILVIIGIRRIMSQ